MNEFNNLIWLQQLGGFVKNKFFKFLLPGRNKVPGDGLQGRDFLFSPLQ